MRIDFDKKKSELSLVVVLLLKSGEDESIDLSGDKWDLFDFNLKMRPVSRLEKRLLNTEGSATIFFFISLV